MLREKGETGDTRETGETGTIWETWERGKTGDTGEKGDTGNTGLTFKKVLKTERKKSKLKLSLSDPLTGPTTKDGSTSKMDFRVDLYLGIFTCPYLPHASLHQNIPQIH